MPPIAPEAVAVAIERAELRRVAIRVVATTDPCGTAEFGAGGDQFIVSVVPALAGERFLQGAVDGVEVVILEGRWLIDDLMRGERGGKLRFHG